MIRIQGKKNEKNDYKNNDLIRLALRIIIIIPMRKMMIVTKIMINMTTKNDSENKSNVIESLQQLITVDNKSNNNSKQHRTYLEIICQSYSAGTSTKPIQNNGHRWALCTRQP